MHSVWCVGDGVGDDGWSKENGDLQRLEVRLT